MRYAKCALIIFSIFLFSCASEEELEARRTNAFDISGTYKTTEDSEVQSDFTIINQNVKYDIFVQFNRTSLFTNQERELLSELAQEHGISVETLTVFPTAFGGDDSLFKDLIHSGDNLSTDLGKTSEFHVCSDNPPEYESKKVVDEEGAKDVKLKILYCFSGTIKRENKNIIEEGRLSLEAFYSYCFEDESKGCKMTHYKEIELSYMAEKISSDADN